MVYVTQIKHQRFEIPMPRGLAVEVRLIPRWPIALEVSTANRKTARCQHAISFSMVAAVTKEEFVKKTSDV